MSNLTKAISSAEHQDPLLEWLAGQVRRDDPVGALSRDVIGLIDTAPWENDPCTPTWVAFLGWVCAQASREDPVGALARNVQGILRTKASSTPWQDVARDVLKAVREIAPLADDWRLAIHEWMTITHTSED